MLAVRHHLLLPSVATRRDIADPRVIHETAEIVGDAQSLHLLYLVSIADGRATGPDVWNAWRAQLLQGLYIRVLDVLSAETGAASATDRRRQAVETALAGRFTAERVQRHLDALPPSYVLSTPAETIAEHLDLLDAAEHATDRTTIRHERVSDIERLTIVTPDRPGILSQVAGVLAVYNVSVLGGVAYTREDGMAIDVMHVGDGLGVGIDERRWERITTALPEALQGRFPTDARLAETRAAYAGRLTLGSAPIQPVVHVDNLGSEAYSIVEVTAEDRIGLLYDITTALHGLALDIHLAKVDTLGREVVDAFYVRRENGRRVDEADEIARLRERVLEAIAPPRRAP
jgi:[protein-PII] uridylyltransferase